MNTATLAIQARRLNAQMPLVLVTDDSGRGWEAAARALPRGSTVLLRAHTANARQALFERLRPLAHLLLLVADDPALARHADGLHLPERRIREAMHWRMQRPDGILTASAHSLRAVIAARALDALFLSPVFPTASHPGAPALGPVRAAFIAAAAGMPVYALGGVTARNAGLLAPAFCGIAAITSLSAG